MIERNYGEISLPPVWTGINPRNGRFLPGHTPANKGKKWSEYMSKRAQKRSSKGWANLDKYRHKGNRNSGRKRKGIICISQDGKWTQFPDGHIASECLGINRENISRCCRSNAKQHVSQKTGKINDEHQYMGYLFYFETDSHIWVEKINKPFNVTTSAKYNNTIWLQAIIAHKKKS